MIIKPDPKNTTNTQTQQAKATAKPTSRSNPPFIYPGTRTGDFANAAVGGLIGQRGYVRRLTEFYKRQADGTDATTVLNSLKCLFQFNPDSITRDIQSDTSMQLFFNQEPAQLAQPVPGKAGYAFELLFNREAEVFSGKYLAGADLLPGRRAPDANSTDLELTTNAFIDDAYHPSWVTELGVLADILILDDILGVGLSQDVITAVAMKNLTLKKDTFEKVDPDDKDKAPTVEPVYDENRMDKFTSNLGNKAFLVPQPIRVVFSNWMMIEGFVTSSQVTFNKYSRGYIPTQCSVAIQMQALYIGFAQSQTFLTELQTVDLANPGADTVTAGTSEAILYDDSKAGLNKFLDKALWFQGSSGVKKVSSFFSKSETSEILNFRAQTTLAGSQFYEQIVKESKVAGEATFTFSGEIKIWWYSHVTNANNSRSVGPTTATTAGGAALTYALGKPPNEGVVDYAQWGTFDNPFIIKIDNHPIYYINLPTGAYKYDALIYGRSADGGDDAEWGWEIADALLPRPFAQDKFNVELKITTFCTRPGIPTIKLPQVIQMKSIVMYDESMKLNPLTVGAFPLRPDQR